MTPFPGPGSFAVSGAGLFVQEPSVESPLPGGIAAVVHFLFNLPAWFQIAGFLAGVLVAGALVYLLWRRRAAIVGWIGTRRREVKISLAAGAAGLVLGFAGFGTASWHYMQHDNGFCTGCHVMGPAYARFTRSEHSSLSCHDCHQQSVFASMRQLYLWVAERPDKIGPHAKVPTKVCASCHVTGQPEVWRRITSTAGHRTHLESDSSALRNVQCVTCHGLEVHRFVPVDSTCAQAGCHVSNVIALGKMRGQTSLHCVACHQFIAEVPALATRDSVLRTLVPGVRQCVSCHQMRALLGRYDPARDPHRGTCGMCHNPHRQKRPADAAAACASCHAGWRSVEFHREEPHRGIVGPGRCAVCHKPHQWKADPNDCGACHAG